MSRPPAERRQAHLGEALAKAFLAGEWDPPAMTRRGQQAVGQRRVWVRDVALAVRHEYPDPPRDRHRDLARFIAVCPPLLAAVNAAWARREPLPRPVRWFAVPTAMAAAPWPVAKLDTVGDLARYLGLTSTELAWFADVRSMERAYPDERLRHYRYRWAPKPTGGARLIEEPKRRLKGFQRMLLADTVGPIPPHPAAHG